MLVRDHDEQRRRDLDSQKHHSKAPCLQRYLDTNDGRDTRSEEEPENEHDCRAKKSGTIVGFILKEFFSSSWVMVEEYFVKWLEESMVKDRSTSNCSYRENLHGFSPDCWICVDSITVLIKRMHLTASSKIREEVSAYDKVCIYKKGALTTRVYGNVHAHKQVKIVTLFGGTSTYNPAMCDQDGANYLCDWPAITERHAGQRISAAMSYYQRK